MFGWDIWRKEEKKPPPHPLSWEALSAQPHTLAAGITIGAVSVFIGTKVYRRYFRRIRNADWITSDMYKDRRWIKGKVVR